MSIQPSDARALTRQLVARAADDEAGADASSCLAARRAIERACGELARWVGASGSEALLSRAIAASRAAHPVLDGVRSQSAGAIDGLVAAVRPLDAKTCTATCEAVLTALLQLMQRLVGPELTMRLLQLEEPDGDATPDDGPSADTERGA